MFDKIAMDFERLYPGRKAMFLKYPEAALTHPGFLACMLFRVQDMLFRSNFRRFASFIRLLNNAWTGADILPGCNVGGGLVLHHPVGVVVGHGVVIGENCTVLQGTTLGERHVTGHGAHLYPIIGNGVAIGAGATVLGPVRLGDGCVIGANSVVLDDVPANSLAVGQPARIILPNGLKR